MNSIYVLALLDETATQNQRVDIKSTGSSVIFVMVINITEQQYVYLNLAPWRSGDPDDNTI